MSFDRLMRPLAAFLLVTAAAPVAAQVEINTLDTAVTQNFDSLGTSAAATLPTGFKISSAAGTIDWTGGGVATTQSGGSGAAASAGGTYNWGNGAAGTATDRALGFLTSGSYLGSRSIILAFTNKTGATIASLDIAFDYEKYRNGTRAEGFTWSFFHGNSSAPTTAATDGNHSYPFDANNLAVNPPTTVSKSLTLTGLSIPNDSTYYIRWTYATAATYSNAQGLGIDNVSLTAKSASTPTLSVGNASVDEDVATNQISIPVTLSAAAAADVTFDITTSDGTAESGAGGDYTATSFTPATIAAGQTQFDLVVPILDDPAFEGDETFTVTISNVSANATLGTAVGTVTIVDDEVPATPTLSINAPSVPEAAGPLTFRVSLSQVSASNVTFNYATGTGTATAIDDYTAIGTTAGQINAGASFVDIPVTIVDDAVTEPNETVVLDITGVSGATPASVSGTGTITNDDLPPPNLSIADVTNTEGQVGTKTYAFVATLDADPGATTLSFDLTTADSTATVADNDYESATTACSLTGTNRTCTLNVTVNADLADEANEQFFVNVVNLVGTVGTVDSQAVGTITNDDDFLPIGQVQGTAQTSPFAGQNVVVRGVVTAKSNTSFWIQDGSCATFPNASCGLLVFGSIAAGAVTIGDEVEVAGPLIEFIPGADPASLPITEISLPTSTTVLSQGNALPAPVDLSLVANIPITNGPLDQLERFEGMRVTVPEFEVTVPTNNGEYASTNSSGTFFGVIAGTPRPKREPGIDVQNALPVGNTAAAVPRWDFNSELLRVKTNLLTGSTLRDLPGRTIVTDLVGVLDYGFRRYTILPDPAAPFVTIAAPTPSAVSAPTSRQFTISTFNVENLLSTNSNYGRKADKITATIVEVLNLPDVIGFVEMGNQTTINDLATRINTAAVTAGLPDPQYVGNVVNMGTFNQEVAVMYKTGAVAPALPRVNLVSIAQFGTTETLRCNDPDGPGPMTGADTGDALNDRPPLVAELEVNAANGVSFPVTVIVNHLKALSGVDSEAAPEPGFECFVSDGARNRAKRHQGAVYLAGLVQARQIANPDENIVLVGDFNAYQFNDGLVDVMGTILGVPAADDATVQPDDGLDLVNPDLSTLISTVTDPDEAYSYIFGGQAQILDHIIVNDDVLAATAPRLEYAHVNADFRRTTDGNSTATIYRSSDHDPSVAYFTVTGFGTPPAIDAIADQAIDEDETLSNLAFGIDDVEDGAALTCASVSVASDNTTLVPAASVTVSGAAQSCTLSLTPASNLSGTANITLTLTDSEGDSSQESFEVTVASLNDAPTISAIGDVTISTNVPGEVSFTIADVEDSLACSAANLSATSSNTALLPVANIVFSGSGGNCTATLTPAVGQSGTSEVTITVSDGTASDASSFQLSVAQGGFIERIFENGFED